MSPTGLRLSLSKAPLLIQKSNHSFPSRSTRPLYRLSRADEPVSDLPEFDLLRRGRLPKHVVARVVTEALPKGGWVEPRVVPEGNSPLRLLGRGRRIFEVRRRIEVIGMQQVTPRALASLPVKDQPDVSFFNARERLTHVVDLAHRDVHSAHEIGEQRRGAAAASRRDIQMAHALHVVATEAITQQGMSTVKLMRWKVPRIVPEIVVEPLRKLLPRFARRGPDQ